MGRVMPYKEFFSDFVVFYGAVYMFCYDFKGWFMYCVKNISSFWIIIVLKDLPIAKVAFRYRNELDFHTKMRELDKHYTLGSKSSFSFIVVDHIRKYL